MDSFFEKLNNVLSRRLVAYLLLFLVSLPLFYFSWYNESWEGEGDNYWHYYFTRYALSSPKFFLHHWGKPIFIFLGTWFAQFGFYGLNVFNILCGLLSGYIAFQWCRRMGFRLPALVIFIVMFSPVYFSAVQSALTEPLFSLLLITVCYLYFFGDDLKASILASALLYSRSEGMFVLIIIIIFLVLHRKWRYIPYLFTFFLLYSFIGLFAGKGFLWYFTENPYSPDSPYGHGTYTHFVDRYEFIYGTPYVITFLVGTLLLLINLFHRKDVFFWRATGPDMKLFMLVFIPCFAFLFFHSYAWGAGKYGSAGLWRVMACVMPLGAVLCMYALNGVLQFKFKWISLPLILFFAFMMVRSAFLFTEYPRKALVPERVEKRAAEWFVHERKTNSQIFYAHPGIIFFCDWDPFDPDNRECHGFPSTEDCVHIKSKPKFYYIWDSYFSAQYCGNTLADMERCPNMKKMREFEEGDFKLVFFETK